MLTDDTDDIDDRLRITEAIIGMNKQKRVRFNFRLYLCTVIISKRLFLRYTGTSMLGSVQVLHHQVIGGSCGGSEPK